MEVKLISHINGDGDLLPAWFRYYTNLGITSFHLIIHGDKVENATIFEMAKEYPVLIENIYEGEFLVERKREYLMQCLRSLRDNWVLLVDSDEFVELPYKKLKTTINKLERAGANALYAPMVQRMKSDGTLESSTLIADPFNYFPLCSIELYSQLGIQASISKYPLFYNYKDTFIAEGGNHTPPNGLNTVLCGLRGITHHFKWKSSVIKRLSIRANSSHTFKHESVGYLKYLNENNYHLPTTKSFYCSRRELFERELLERKARVHKKIVERFDENYKWIYNVRKFIQNINKVIPVNTSFILFDENQIPDALLASSKFKRLVEREGEYWGLPEDDETAVNEIKQLEKEGREYIVIAWQCFWCLKHYSYLKSYIMKTYKCIMSNSSAIIFQNTCSFKSQ